MAAPPERPAAVAEALELIDTALDQGRVPAATREALLEATIRLNDADLVSRRDVDLVDPDNALIDALAAAQGDFPTIVKSKVATVTPRDKPGYTYNYADLADVLAAVRPVLSTNGLAIVQTTHHDAGKVILVTELRHRGGGRLVSTIELGQQPGNPQAFGGALTYLRRYELTTVLGIAAEDDRDAQDVPVAGRDTAAPAAAPLPAWASPLRGDDAKRELVDVVEELVGNRDLAKELARRWAEGYEGVRYVMLDAARGIRNARKAAADPAAAAAAKRAEQDRAAEAPDTPPPAEDAEPADPGLTPEEEAEVERQAREANGPPPGSVKVDLEPIKTPAGRIQALVKAGCTCTAPLDTPHDDQCPIEGHGIPF